MAFTHVLLCNPWLPWGVFYIYCTLWGRKTMTMTMFGGSWHFGLVWTIYCCQRGFIEGHGEANRMDLVEGVGWYCILVIICGCGDRLFAHNPAASSVHPTVRTDLNSFALVFEISRLRRRCCLPQPAGIQARFGRSEWSQRRRVTWPTWIFHGLHFLDRDLLY